MSTPDESDLARVFEMAAEVDGPEREALLDRECAGDEALRQRVEAILAAHADGGSFLEQGGFEVQSSGPLLEEGTRVGRYVIGEQIGAGGFAIVYRADQTEPVRRTVALKVIKPGMDSRQVIARFEAERQALAVMDHPGVAKVLDAGATDDGRPYFVMEHVPGVPITEHCDEHRLSIDERLRLFVRVCEAVQHAHQKGIIHRDLKPSNILVATGEDSTLPKVIDFGIAKALDQRLGDETIVSEEGRMIGTPEYMSPEQAEGTSEDIDTRSDVYALGVLLYELLTGERPFDLKNVALLEIRRRIVETDPPKPSTRLSGLGEATTNHADQRGADTRSVARRIRGDLDWIVMRCLEKDRTRRYDTASGLATDVDRHLNHEPVQAGPPSATYRITKFVRRNRLAVTAAAAVVVVLLGGLAGTTWGRSSAKQQAKIAGEARDAESAAKAEALNRARELEQVVEYQTDLLTGVDVDLMGARLRRDLVKEARDAWSRSGPSGPEIDAQISSLEELLAGTNFTDLAVHALSENLFEIAVEGLQTRFDEHPVVKARLLDVIATALLQIGVPDLAAAQQAQAFEIYRRELGNDHPDTLTSMSRLARSWHAWVGPARAEPYYYEALEGRRRLHGETHPNTLRSIVDIGWLLQTQGRLDDAEPYYREALEHQRVVLGDEHPDTLGSINTLSGLLQAQGRFAEAELLCLEALASRRRLLGGDHPKTLNSISSMCYLLRRQGRLDEAEPYCYEALAGLRRVLGNEHPKTLSAIGSMGGLLCMQGDLAAAELYCREADLGRLSVLFTEHPDTLSSMDSMGFVLQRIGKIEEADLWCNQALQGRRRVLGDEHPDTLDTIENIGDLRRRQGSLAEAEACFRQVLAGRRQVLREDHPDTLRSITRVGRLTQEQGRLAEAEVLYREALERCRRVFGEDPWQTAESRSLLAEALTGLGQLEEAEALLLDAWSSLDASSPPARRAIDLPLAIQRLIHLYEAWGKPELSAEWQAKLDEIEAESDR